MFLKLKRIYLIVKSEITELMKFRYLKLSILITVFFVNVNFSQETLPLYLDYLSDNVFLVHPSAAGVGNSSKLRFTARQQWMGIPDAPALQTVSFHGRPNEFSNVGYGFILFNDKNGYHSQKGIQGTYAYHLRLNESRVFNQLSFGLGFTLVHNQVDQRSFTGDLPGVVSQIIESTGYYNADFSMAYHLGGFSSYFTVKNLLLNTKNNLNKYEPLNMKNYIFSSGYFFGEENYIQLEPSIMVQFKQGTGERIADFNIKAYKTISETRIWAALSFRKSFDSNAIENSQYITPIIGVNYKKFMFSYTFTKQINDIVLTNTGFHQVTLGIDLFTRMRRGAACPNINSAYKGY